MTREIKILVNFTSYILLGFLICLIGLSNVFASTYNATQFTAQLYDNYGPSLISVTTDFTNNRYQGIIPTMIANSSGGAWGISSPVTLVSNHTYTLTAEITGSYGGKLVLSTYNRIGVGTTLNNAKTSYENNSNVKEIYSKVQDNGYTIQFAFTPTINASYIIFPFATNYSGDIQTFYLENIVIDDLGSESLTEEQISNSLNAQTNELNNSINNMGEGIKDSIKDTFEDCRDSYNLLNMPYTENNKLTNTAERGDHFWETPYNVYLENGQTYTFSFNSDFNNDVVEVYIYYNYSEGGFFRATGANKVITFTPTISGNYFIRYDINNPGVTASFWNFQIVKGSSNKPFEEYGKEICQNKIDETNDKLDETNNQLGDLNNNITNDNIDDNNVSNAFNQFENFIDENATISTLLTLPVTLFSSILNGLQNTCSPFNLGSLYGEDLILPCIDISSYLGNTLWTMIDIIISGFAIYFISQKFIKVFNTFSSMKEGDVIDD